MKWLFTRNKWNNELLAEFSRLVRLQLENGIVITYGMKLIKEVLPKKLWSDINLIIYHLEQGLSLEMALKHSGIPELCITMVSIGESHGNLAKTFEQCEWFYQQRNELRKTIKTTAAYPMLLIFLIVLFIIFLTTSLLPQFLLLYQTTQIELPKMTQFLLDSHQHLINFLWVYLLLIFVIAGFIFWVIKTNYRKRRWYRYFLRFPILRNYLQKKYTYTFSFYLSLFINNGVFLLKGLELLNTYPSLAIRDASNKVMDAILNGHSLAESLQAQKIFLLSFIEMTRLYETTGALDKGLRHYSNHLQKQLELEMKHRLKWLEPILILIIGLILLFILYALFLPIFTLISAV